MWFNRYALYYANLQPIAFFLFVGQKLEIKTKFMMGNVIFTWTPSNQSSYDVFLTRDKTDDPWDHVIDAKYTARDVLKYDTITINVRTSGLTFVDHKMRFNGTFLLSKYIV